MQNRQSAPFMSFIFSLCSRQSCLPEAEMIWEPKKPHHILAEVTQGIALPSLNGGLCLGALHLKNTCLWSVSEPWGQLRKNFY